MGIGAASLGVAAATTAAGGALMTVGAINNQAAADASRSQAGAGAEIEQLREVAHQLGGSFDTRGISAAQTDLDSTTSRWERSGLVTAVAGGLGLAGGISALALQGSHLRHTGGASAAALAFGIGMGAIAGLSGIVALDSYRQIDDRRRDVSRERNLAVADLKNQVAMTQLRPPMASAVAATHLALRPLARPDAAGTADHAARGRVDSVATVARHLASFDDNMGAGAGDTTFRSTLNERLKTPVPLIGPVDWTAVATSMDASGDGSLDFAEREASGGFQAQALGTYSLMTASRGVSGLRERVAVGEQALRTLAGAAGNSAEIAGELRREAGVKVRPDGSVNWTAVATNLEQRKATISTHTPSTP